jgi:hypothetical protein
MGIICRRRGQLAAVWMTLCPSWNLQDSAEGWGACTMFLGKERGSDAQQGVSEVFAIRESSVFDRTDF